MDYTAELNDFFSQPKQQVLMIEGEWGVGKTYFWRRFIEMRRLQETERYAYVSLFGIDSLEMVRNCLLAERWLPPGCNDNQRPNAFKGIVNTVGKIIQGAELKGIKMSTFTPLLERIMLKGALICFDDLERRSEKLDLKELLGLISQFKEQYICKIVVICNSGEFSEDDQKTLAKFREKIIDRHLNYSPRISDNYSLVFKNEEDRSILDLFERTNISNIRVMERVRWTMEYFEPHLSRAKTIVRNEFRLQAAKLTLVHFAFSNLIDIDDLRGMDWRLVGWVSKTLNQSLTVEQTECLTKLQYTPSQIDDSLHQFLRKGFVEESEAKKMIVTLEASALKIEAELEMRRLWEMLSKNFMSNEEDLKRAFYAFLEKWSNLFEPVTVHYFACLLNDAGIEVPLEMVTEKLTSRIEQMSPSERNELLDHCADGEINKLVIAIMKRTEEEIPSISDLVRRLTDSSWNPSDIELLEKHGEDALHKWIYQSRGDVFRELKLLMRRSEGGILSGMINRVLEQIAETNKLNALRVKRYMEGQVKVDF